MTKVSQVLLLGMPMSESRVLGNLILGSPVFLECMQHAVFVTISL